MNRLAMSRAGERLFRALVERADVNSDRILLTDYRSNDWQSLTFVGEQHYFDLRLPGPDSRTLRDRLCEGLEEFEFRIPRHVLADIHVEHCRPADDGSLEVRLIALTIEE